MVGQHLLVEYQGCDCSVLEDLERVEHLMRSAAQAAHATVVAATFHRFAPHGVSGVVVLAESHISIHTWPEHGYAAVDIYTCGHCQPELARELLGQGLGAQRTETMIVRRGGSPSGPSLGLCQHVSATRR